MFAHSLKVKKFDLTHRYNPITLYIRGHSGPGSNSNEAAPHIPQTPKPEPFHEIVSCHTLDNYWGGVLLLCRDAVGVFYSSSWLGCKPLFIVCVHTVINLFLWFHRFVAPCEFYEYLIEWHPWFCRISCTFLDNWLHF